MNIGIFTINSSSNLNELNDNTDVHILLTSISVKRKNVSYTDARPSFFFSSVRSCSGNQFKNILRQFYDYLTIMPKLRSTYDVRLLYETSYERREDFHRYDLLAKS